MSIPDHILHASKGLAGFSDPMGDLIVDFGAAREIAAQVREGIHRFQFGTIDIDVSCGVGGIGRRLMHHNRFITVYANDPMGDLIVGFGAAREIAAQVREGIHRFQFGTIDIDGSCGVGGIGRRLMHHNRFLTVYAKSEVVTGGREEVHAPLNFLFCRCIEYAVVSEEKFGDVGCGDTRAEVHPTLVEESAVHPVGNVDPGAIFTVGIR
ncbi:unnamed protein product [Schistocephalus solidus]|uniref:Methyltransferase n=1 Tax=Schistocephalus solidus TaxID=70667 RepID=A0A183TJN5_SCHSO|nr:unnamed protein product [Schistocephalus solidus]